ncbi:MAG: EF-hand domain-containing protein [Planctomycetaceae bacterium]|nr:EF-hand domain-containing protein [Planctomycetaceae bacterium]
MNIRLAATCTVMALATSMVMAQPPREGGGDRPEGRGPRGFGSRDGRPPMVPPMMLALDADGDGKISAAELANAVNALKALDKNNDGELTMEEIMPPRREGDPRFGERGPRDGEGRGPGDFFAQMDKDGDGKLSKEEAPERMRETFDRLDLNKDGFIDQEEIRQMMERFRQGGPGRPDGPGRPGAPGANLEDRMKELDKDGDGKISLDEAPERMKQGFDRLDTNKDGFIDLTEMRQIMERVRDSAPGGPGRPANPETN